MLLAYSIFAVSVAAFPALQQASPNDPRFSNWVPPGPGDVRSPCPGLNSLANHNFIPHSGKGMTVPILIQGLLDGLNVGPDFSAAIGGLGVLSSPNPAGGSFDLDMLDEHNFPIEHDASLSRLDAYFGNDYTFQQSRFSQVLSYYDGMTETDIPHAARARYSRVLDSEKTNPTFTYGPMQFLFSLGETGLYIQTMSDPVSGVAPLNFIESLFEQERLPYNLGWRRSVGQINFPTLFNMAVELYASNPSEQLPEGLRVLTLGAFQDAFEGINPATGILGNATS